MNPDDITPEEAKSAVLNVTVLDWQHVPQLEQFYGKRAWKKLKRPVVLSVEEVEAQARLPKLKAKLDKLRKRANSLSSEMITIHEQLRRAAENRVQPILLPVSRRCNLSDEEFDELPEEAYDATEPPVVTRHGGLGAQISARIRTIINDYNH